ncbi:ATP-binding cassette domain-containing protein [bacterium]|nr:MAG: ATP-binding cassette domain-containing protein [bacterium]
MIKVENLVKKFKKTSEIAVNDVSFEVKEGEFFAFLGPNGAGKTTTISILTTILSKTSGVVKIDNLDIDKDQDSVRQKIGIIFQKPSLDENLTAEENIRIHSSLYGVTTYRPTFALMPNSYKAKINELFEVVDLDHKELFKSIKTFSGGMKRKLEIVRSMMHEPKVLFLDEPTTGLDPSSRRSLWNYLNQIRKEKNITIFLTTHYLDEVENADHIVILKKGKVAFDGDTSQMKSMLSNEAKKIIRQGPSLEDAYLEIINC